MSKKQFKAENDLSKDKGKAKHPLQKISSGLKKHHEQIKKDAKKINMK